MAHHADRAQVRASHARQLAGRAEAWDVERVQRDRCAQHEAGRRGRAATHLARARVEAAAAAQREVGALRRELATLRGLVLVLGPPCSGKSTRCEALAAQLGLTHASLPALLHDCAASEVPPSLPPSSVGRDELGDAPRSRSNPKPDALGEALRRGEALPAGGVLELLRRAAAAAESGLLLLEVPAQAGLLPSLLLLLPPPLLLLLLDAPDEVPHPNPHPIPHPHPHPNPNEARASR